MNARRTFLKQLTGTAAALSAFPLLSESYGNGFNSALQRVAMQSPNAAATDDDFWQYVRQEYIASPNIINLNNGGVSPQPRVVLEALEQYNRMCAEAPSYYMWRILDKGRESLRLRLADMAGAQQEEVSICRNSTEALDIIIFGLNLEKGDEVVLTKFDYPNVKNAWKQREKRDGIKLIWLDLPMPAESDDEIVAIYDKAITNKTKVVNITHMINWTGQVLPARRIADAAHAKGAKVMIDGAHTFAHLDYKIPDLGGDYFGTSLHKWLCAPLGTGMLWVKKDNIPGLWPICPNDDPQKDDIRKFEHLGTRSFPTEHAVGHAINFHQMIGTGRKEARLRWLREYWMDQVKDVPGIKFYASTKSPNHSCALMTFGVAGKEGADIGRYLFAEYKLHTTTINHEGVNGVRVTPHVYTTTYELDRLAKAIKEIAKA